MRKFIAFVLAAAMVVCTFTTLSVSSAAENLLSGKDCIFKNVAAWSMYPAAGSDPAYDTTTLFTDGAFRGDGTNAFSGDSAISGVTFDTTIAGPKAASSYAGFYTFDLGASKEIAKIVIKGYREANNRSWGQNANGVSAPSVYVSDTAFDLAAITNKATAQAFPADGVDAVASVEKVAIEGAPLYNEAEQFYDATLNLAEGTVGRYVLVKTNSAVTAGIFQADEIEAYGPEAGDSDDSSDVESSEVESSEVESSEVESSEVESSEVESSEVESSEVESSEVESSDVESSDVESSEDESSEVESSEEESSEAASEEEIDDMALENVAGDAEYKGTEGDDNGTSGNYCDTPIGEWLNYHTGKLNDGIIPEGDSATTLGQNVEIWNERMGSGNNTVIFKLAEETDVRKVNVYMNNRTNNANTGYPEKIEIYVGNSENMAEATLMGEAVTTDPEGAIRKHTVSGNISGQYVFIYFTVGAKWRITLSEVEIMSVGTPINQAPNAEYKGEGDDNGTTGAYCEVGAEWNEYHSGKLNDGTIATDASNSQTGVSVEFFNEGYAVGTNQLTFKFDYEVYVSEVIAYFNTRTNSANRGYPSLVKVYVGNSENVEEATLIGEATTTDTGYVRAYSVSGNAKGTYVIFEMDITAPVAVIALTEVEIIGFGTPAEPELPSLEAPVLSGNLTQMETFEAPTITWEAVEGAVSYDAYINGILVTEGITGTSYVPDMDPVITYASNTNYTKVQIVAKGDGVTYDDSALSESYNFFYVAKPVDLRGNKVTSADILIDPGHGGSQPGAVGVYANGDQRQEKVDTLNMSLKVGEYFESLGYTVAYTRNDDRDVGLMARAAMANAGEFRAYICIHRNSFTTASANGIETLYQTGDANDQAFAQFIQDEIMALGGFTDRGIKARDNLVVLNNTSAKTPLCLVELGFISNENDNNMYDAMFDDLAYAIVAGTVKYLGDELPEDPDEESSDVESSDEESSDVESSEVESSDVESSDVESSDEESSDEESS
ncbi:MAG: N-acetylmuramoyl-L-alanine amidase, partial [Clostridia bacterium]|nr:N-acetylmuramoyl-L-alanine amidase [Clostridia bacterium]